MYFNYSRGFLYSKKKVKAFLNNTVLCEHPPGSHCTEGINCTFVICHNTKTIKLLDNAHKLSKQKCLVHSGYEGCSSPMGVVLNVKRRDWNIDCVLEGIENIPHVRPAL